MFPTLVHWKPGHFSVVVSKEQDGRYLISDAATNRRHIVSSAVLDEETSGACLIPGQSLPAGWSPLDRASAEQAIGRSTVVQSADDSCNESCGPCQGVAAASFNLFRASLVVSDTPLADSAPRGENISVHATWAQHSSSILHTLSYQKLGSGTNWTLGYGAYIDQGSGDRIVFDETGNRTTHVWNGTAFNRQLVSRKQLVKVYTAGSFVGFQLIDESGSCEEYLQPGKEVALPFEQRRFFLTKRKNTQGMDTCTITYESGGLGRILSVAGTPDAAHLDFTYYGSLDYRLFAISDNRPWNWRTCYFYYDSSDRLQKITDVYGIESTFTYTGSFLNGLTTPYGTSSFNSATWGTGGNWGRFLDLTDARGWTQRVLYSNDIGTADYAGKYTITDETPSAVSLARITELHNGCSFHWDKKMMADHLPGDPRTPSYANFDKARHVDWMQESPGYTVGVPASERLPEDGGYRTFYVYEGQGSSGVLNGSSRVATKARRVYAWDPATSGMNMVDQTYQLSLQFSRQSSAVSRPSWSHYAVCV